MNYIPYRIIDKFGPCYLNYNSEANEVRYCCPKCLERKGTPDTKGHLYVNTKSFVYHCYRCDYSGYIPKVKGARTRDYKETDETYEEIYKKAKCLLKEENKFKLKIPIDKVTTSQTATEYLLKRGFTYDQMEYYDLRVGNLSSEFGRIVIPNEVSRLVYTDMYSARSYIDQVPKYHNPSLISKSQVVFNLHRIKEGTPIILVEGALTAIAAGYHAVASLGKNLSKSQASQIIMKHPSVIYVNYDYQAETNLVDACSLLYSLNPEIPIYQTFMKDERDAADLSHEEYTECLKESIRYDPLSDKLKKIMKNFS